ncbi:Eco57I restriction-modification methylase domain-containing protein [Halomicronema hongdechloris]|uniref:Eco57I restriction-modification methylase domain-containing protein n=1 Tax=Halomicronema hongdechloris TaxID=1209493 RepID=UPI001930F95E|nr:N-6 DNA methylase [Halomicronema hongdechloris]
MQEFLNRSDDHLWAFVSNGRRLRILRDNASLTRQAYVEFDLEAMMAGEVYADFVLLWLLCHQSRVEAEKPEQCWLEVWSKTANDQGKRALEALRDGVETAIASLGQGFLTHSANRTLRQKLQSGELATQDYYRQLLRLVYRLLFLFVAEDRELLLDPNATPAAKDRYTLYYSTARLRTLAEKRRGTRHSDLFHGLRLVMEKLGSEHGCPELALPALGSFLWSSDAVADLLGNSPHPLTPSPNLGEGGQDSQTPLSQNGRGAGGEGEFCQIANTDLLDAIRALAFILDKHGRRPVDYKNLQSEELGSVYESLLELHPELNISTGTFSLKTASGNERKTTGSYYTPESLVQCLLDSALDPVVDEAISSAVAADDLDAETALLNLKICDPACGSGHFLIAAAHRLAKRLAFVRTGDEEPAPEATQTALRDVIGRCIYGVDVNPMAVELCKVALWMEALEPGKPLSFLDHHIQCGNSLLGATPALLRQGIPDDAFKPIEGDDKAYCSKYKKQNKEERKGQLSLLTPDLQPWERLGDLATSMAQVDDISDDDYAGVQRKRQQYEAMVQSTPYLFSRFWADAWCAAFVWLKRPPSGEEANRGIANGGVEGSQESLLATPYSSTRSTPPSGFPYPITEEVFRRIERNPHSVDKWMRDEVERLRDQYQFFHWHLAFPDVFQVRNGESGVESRESEDEESLEPGWDGGFDVVLGNPPWERIKIQEKEWFASRRPDISKARNAATRRRKIADLEQEDPELFHLFKAACRQAEGESLIVRDSGRYPLCGRGDINTYTIFTETMYLIIGSKSYLGCVVPSGIATDDSNKVFIQEIIKKGTLVSFFDFTNRGYLFNGTESTFSFSLLTISKSFDEEFHLAAQAWQVDHLKEKERVYVLSREDILRINPNTQNLPIFISAGDAKRIKSIYSKIPVLLNENPYDNPWSVSFLGMLHMTNDSSHFRTQGQLKAERFSIESNSFVSSGTTYLPLYESKFAQIFNHRGATFTGIPENQMYGTRAKTNKPTKGDLKNPLWNFMPRYWVPSKVVEEKIPDFWKHEWLVGFRNAISAVADARSVAFTIIPKIGVGNSMPLIFSQTKPLETCLLVANLNSFVLDYVAKQKASGGNLNFYIVKQLPIVPPQIYSQQQKDFISGNVLELTYTAWDLQPFAQDCGYEGPPFKWDEDRRFLLRCELDAAYFHLYGIQRDDVDYIMETFPIVKRKDEKAHGHYRTKDTILQIYDAMATAIASGQPYPTLLDPPPADPRVAHPPRESEIVSSEERSSE